MNNDDLHLNKIIQQFDNSMQNINNSSNQNDDNCMELLDKITFDDSTSNFIPSSSNCTIQNSNFVEIKDDDKYCQEIMSALEKKDFTRILTLAISQSQNGHKMNGLLSETIQEIEKSSNKQVDVKMIEKLHSLLRSQPKTIGATPLRATVAPIRNESIMCSSSSNISNNSGFRSNKSTVNKSESVVSTTDDFMSFISSECKLPSGTRSLPATPAIAQIPNRPLSSHCVPIRSNEQRKPHRLDCDMDQPQSIQQQIPFYGNQAPQMQYLPLNMSQFAQYPSSLMAPNIVLMPMMNSPQQSQSDQSQNVNGTHSMTQPNALAMSQASQSNNVNPNQNNAQNNNQISLLLSSAAFFGMSNNQQPINNQVTVTTSHDASGLGIGTNTMTSVRSPAITPHGSSSNLPKLLPKPQQPIIMPRNMQQYTHQIQQHQQIHPSSTQQHQQFKRPSNRKSSVKTRNTSKSAKNATSVISSKKESCNKDNVAVAWEIAEQSGSTEDMIIHQSPSTSFVTELTSITPDEFCLIQPGTGMVTNDPIDLFCTDPHLSEGTTHEFDDLLDELVMMSCDNVCYGRLEIQETYYESCVTRLDPVKIFHAAFITYVDELASIATSNQLIPSSNCVVISRQSPLNFDDNSQIRAGNVDSQRVMQLLYAHFGRHNATLLSPLLKCLLPPIGVGGVGGSSGGGPSGDGLTHQSHHQQSDPLSVCTRLSEQDELTEDDLLGDISPVKRDPSHLVNLDRFLESCQSISPCNSLHEYCEEPTSSFDEPHKLMMMMMPYQSMVANNNNSPLTLQDFCNPQNDRNIISWLRKSKQLRKWSLNGTVIRSSKVLEVPAQSSNCNTDTIMRGGNYHQMNILRKKSTFKKLDTVFGFSKKDKMNKKSRQEKRTIKYLQKIRDIKFDLHGNDDNFSVDIKKEDLKNIVAQVPSNCFAGAEKKIIKKENVTTIVTNNACCEDLKSGNNIDCNTTERLKMRISVSKLKVVQHTAVVSCDATLPVPPPLPPNKIIKPPRRTKIKQKINTTSPTAAQRQFKKHTELNIKRIFCTRKEERRSSALISINSSPNKHRKRSPYKNKRVKQMVEHPPLILKLKTRKVQSEAPILGEEENVEEVPPPSVLVAVNTPVQTSGSLKLRLKRSQDDLYKKFSDNADFSMKMLEPLEDKNGFEFNKVVTLAPPMQIRARPHVAALQFSPTHSSSDSDVDVAHNEINSLLQRQEQRDPITSSSVTSGQSAEITKSHQHNQHQHPLSFPQLPVPYLVGSEPTVFIDPHKCDLIIVKNSKYKKVSQRCEAVSDIGAGGVNVVSEPSNNEVFVPGCFIEEEKSTNNNHVWNNHSSPSMPVLAPQEPFSGTDDGAGKSSHISLSTYDYNNPAVIAAQPNQSYSESSDHIQQSPLCMTTSTNPLQNSQYSTSQKDMRPDPIKSPYGHASYYHQQSYNGSCYLQDNSVTNPVIQSSKTQIHSSPVAPLQTTPGSSHIQDYSPYFQNNLLASTDNNSFSSLSLASSSVYQPITDHQTSKHSNTKRSSSGRSHLSEQVAPPVSTKKQRKESQSSAQSSLQLSAYSKNTDIYSTAAAAASTQYSNFDYYNGFNDIINGIDRKFYEQWTRECSSTLGHLCPTNLPWMAEYCKQAANFKSPGVSVTSSSFGLPNSNPLSLTTSNLHGATDYSNELSHSVDSLKPLPYLDPYYAYAMAQPYMNPFGIPK